jgi:PleD family two-component response regulator
LPFALCRHKDAAERERERHRSTSFDRSSVVIEFRLGSPIAYERRIAGELFMVIEIDEALGLYLSQVKVLLVDDDEGMHEMMRLFLGKTEFSLVSATNAPDALEMINS